MSARVEDIKTIVFSAISNEMEEFRKYITVWQTKL